VTDTPEPDPTDYPSHWKPGWLKTSNSSTSRSNSSPMRWRQFVTTTNWTDCQKLAKSVAAVGGELPPVLTNLLAGYDVLAAPGRAEDPAAPLIDAVLQGQLDDKKLAELLPVAAAGAWAVQYRQELARSAEHVLLGQFHRELKKGACDAVIASMRKTFNRHAEQVARAKTLISSESSVEHILATGTPELVTAWQELPGHLAVVSKIGLIAANFGASPVAQFGQITQYALADNHHIADAAIMATAGPLLTDSSLFMAPDQGGRTSPWFRCGGLRLWTIAEAQGRYNSWAADEFDRIHSGPVGGMLIDGQVVDDPRPENPYRTKELAR
jgi:hypothetical protein